MPNSKRKHFDNEPPLNNATQQPFWNQTGCHTWFSASVSMKLSTRPKAYSKPTRRLWRDKMSHITSSIMREAERPSRKEANKSVKKTEGFRQLRLAHHKAFQEYAFLSKWHIYKKFDVLWNTELDRDINGAETYYLAILRFSNIHKESQHSLALRPIPETLMGPCSTCAFSQT
ncbi:576_t:CDS:2 [Ambispora leptoticha]|uniref:576_t:CDS:1 n=1 Tax=Ambispora leptoticha TaxID=144679 RepID=A0A9N8V6B9_9GLOM|nr:576_t:CDS:2 [Ambispora leptoticha]